MVLPIPTDSAEPKTILLAEDDASMRRFVEVTLTKAGYRVISAEDGVAALRLADAHAFEAIVADAIMPGMSGYDLCRALAHKKIPSIILSGLESSSREAGVANLFLTKDERLKERLLEALAGLL